MKTVENRNGEANIEVIVRGIPDDMGGRVIMDLIQQADGDVIVALQDTETGRRLSMEFCTSAGGGRDPEITRALAALVKAAKGAAV